jgi:Protein of unknown function (DUF1329)
MGNNRIGGITGGRRRFWAAGALAGCVLLQLVAAQARAADIAAPGTVINKKNWQQYQKFMPPGMIVLFSGDNFWKVPDDGQIVVGPTIPIPTPKRYLADTEKYSGQVKLEKQPNGGYLIKNYLAGWPFPGANPKDPLFGTKTLYNYYYRPAPAFLEMDSRSYLVDSNLNRSWQEAFIIFTRLTHRSDNDLPISDSLEPTLYTTEYAEETAPEQSKYTAILIVRYDNPGAPDEQYLFLPSLRRSLRTSTKARCAPLLGTDFTQDDVREGFNGEPGLFNATYLGMRKVVALVHQNEDVFSSASLLNPDKYYTGSMLWPKPTVGKWEMRDVYVVSLSRVPADAVGYCMSKKVMYFDKETLYPVWDEDYDTNGRLWKLIINWPSPIKIPGTNDEVLGQQGSTIENIMDMENRHLTFVMESKGKFNSDIPAHYRDVKRFADPGGLWDVMR